MTDDEVLFNKERLERLHRARQAELRSQITSLASNLPFDERFITEIWSIPHPSPLLLGRENLTQDIGRLLESHPYLILQGEEGIGKKEAALAYAQRFVGLYTLGFFLESGDLTPLMKHLNVSPLKDLKDCLLKEKCLLIAPMAVLPPRSRNWPKRQMFTFCSRPSSKPARIFSQSSPFRRPVFLISHDPSFWYRGL